MKNVLRNNSAVFVIAAIIASVLWVQWAFSMPSADIITSKYTIHIYGDKVYKIHTNDYTLHDHMTIAKDFATNKEVIIRSPHIIREN